MTPPIIPERLDDATRADLQAKVQQAKARGFDDQAIDSYLQQRFGVGVGEVYASPMPQHGAARTALDNFANMNLWGLGTRLSAAASSVKNSQGHDLSLYRFYLDALQNQQKQNTEAHRGAAIAGTLTGAVTSPLNKFLPVGGAGATGIALRSGAGGAIAGGIGGAADAPAGETLSGGVKGALGGAVFGALLPGGIAAARQVASPPLAAATRLLSVIKGAGGEKALTTEAQRLAALGRGGEVMLADLHPKLGALADQVATTSDDARQIIKAATDARQAEQAGRVLGDVRAGLKGAEPSIAVRQAELEGSRRAWADEAYGALREGNPTVDAPAFQAAAGNLIGQPKVAQIWKEARDVGLIGTLPDEAAKAIKAWESAAPPARTAVEAYGQKLKALIEQGVPEAKAREALGAEPAIPGMPAPSFEMLQNMKERLDDAAGHAFSQKRGALGTRLNSAKEAIDRFLIGNVKGYAETNAEYARRKGMERALESGAEWWGKNDVPGLAKHVATLTPDGLQEFRVGMAAKLVEELSSAKTNRDVATALSNAGRAEQAKLRIVFGDEATFRQFMQQQAAERQLSGLKGASAGSPTARRLNAGVNALASALAGAGVYANNPALAVGAAATYGAKLAAQRAMVNQANELAPMLATTGPDAIQRLIEQLATRRSPLLSPTLQRALTGASGGVGGQIGPRVVP